MWFEQKKSKRSINTKAMYRNVINKHIIPSVGFIPISELTRSDCQTMINERWKKAETCNKIQLTMRQMQKIALREHLIKSEFWFEIEMPKKPKSTKRALYDFEKKAILKAELPPMEQCFLLLLFSCGLRREEMLALRVSDFDFKKSLVHIRRVVVFDENNPIEEDRAKSYSGERDVPIPKSTATKIKKYVKTRDGLLFTMQNGSVMTKSSYDKMWARIIKALDAASDKTIDSLTAHIFRHNYATMLYYSGISELKAVELMGHADGKMIREVYAHLDEGKEKTKERLDSVIIL